MPDKVKVPNVIKLREYIQRLQELEKKVGDVPVVYASDEEGNQYRKVIYQPSAGKMTDAEDAHGTLVEFEFADIVEETNCVCIN